MLDFESRTDVRSSQFGAGFDVLVKSLADLSQIFGVGDLHLDSFPESLDEIFHLPLHGAHVLDDIMRMGLYRMASTPKYREKSGNVD
jgi:hypothetical protein